MAGPRTAPSRTRRGLAAAAAAVLLAAPALTGCGGSDTASGAASSPHPRTARFDAPAAMRLIRLQLDQGPRPAGTPALRRTAALLRARMPNGRYEAIPNEPLLRNVVATIPGTKPAIVIGAHYDVLAKPQGFLGANNGAGGSAIVVQLARTFAKLKRPAGAPELRFVLFDGEEPAQGLPEEQADFYNAGLRGSRAYVAAHGKEVGAMILLDYVANRGLRLPREKTSDQTLWGRIRAAARRVGVGQVFPDRADVAITDDHTPFLNAGIPAVDMIDWSYEGHDISDTYDKLSVLSVDAVGETLVETLRTLRP